MLMWYQCNTVVFLSTLSLRRATRQQNRPLRHSGFLSTLSLRRATLAHDTYVIMEAFLSTLSLRRATKHFTGAESHDPDFYPRSPCGERRFDSGTFVPAEKFLSTLSLRRATQAKALKIAAHGISIHALLAESDLQNFLICLSFFVFLSTLSLRRATGRIWSTAFAE